jgi:hypothetical protein
VTKRSTLSQLRRTLYLSQRAMGDYQAAQRGRLAKRLVRRSVTRSVFRLFR